MIVKASSVLELSLGLMTAADEYLSDASIEIQVVILQTGPVFPFDLLIFNYG